MNENTIRRYVVTLYEIETRNRRKACRVVKTWYAYICTSVNSITAWTADTLPGFCFPDRVTKPGANAILCGILDGFIRVPITDSADAARPYEIEFMDAEKWHIPFNPPWERFC